MTQDLVPFPLLADPNGYVPCHTDLALDPNARAYWLEQFEALLPVQLAAARSAGFSTQQCDAVRDEFRAELEQCRLQPDRFGALNILVLDELRQRIMIEHGIVDEFRHVKQRENEATLPLLGRWLAQLDALPFDERVAALMRGMLAGNLFDMGTQATAQEYATKSLSFEDALQRVPDRPWFVDDVEALLARWRSRPWRKAVVFADNAGADATLGLLPLVRELLRRGVEQVVVTANDTPVWNDITADELHELLQRASAIDAIFNSQRLVQVSSGTAMPLIDLRRVSPALAQASADAELVVLIGMGRSVESNWEARFTCDALNVAMLKDPHTAQAVGGTLFDAVARFRTRR